MEARRLFRELVEEYFSEATVTLANQSRAAKPALALVTLSFGAVKRTLHPVKKVADGVEISSYPSRVTVQVDVFTHGAAVYHEGELIGYEDSSTDDMSAFVDFLNSQYVLEWGQLHDVSVLVDGDIQCLTGVVNDNNYEYRSRITVQLYYTHRVTGRAAVLDEDSLLYPHEDEEGETVYTPEEPPETESTVGGPTGNDADISDEKTVVIEPHFEPTTSGGGSQKLADEETGYFTEAEITEEDKDK